MKIEILKRGKSNLLADGKINLYSVGVNNITFATVSKDSKLIHIELSREEIQFLISEMNIFRNRMSKHYDINFTDKE